MGHFHNWTSSYPDVCAERVLKQAPVGPPPHCADDGATRLHHAPRVNVTMCAINISHIPYRRAVFLF